MADEKVIRAPKNDPDLVSGSLLVADEPGNPTERTRRMVALWRCGGLQSKPYGDSTHKSNGFTAPEVILHLH